MSIHDSLTDPESPVNDLKRLRLGPPSFMVLAARS
jgi:hypothetical protein